MASLRLFAAAREAAGVAADTVEGDTVAEILAAASRRYGSAFAAQLEVCRIWVNGDPAEADTPVAEGDEVAVLPPVSGGGAR